MDFLKTTFDDALDKRDEDQRKIPEALDRMLATIDTRL